MENLKGSDFQDSHLARNLMKLILQNQCLEWQGCQVMQVAGSCLGGPLDIVQI